MSKAIAHGAGLRGIVMLGALAGAAGCPASGGGTETSGAATTTGTTGSGTDAEPTTSGAVTTSTTATTGVETTGATTGTTTGTTTDLDYVVSKALYGSMPDACAFEQCLAAGSAELRFDCMRKFPLGPPTAACDDGWPVSW